MQRCSRLLRTLPCARSAELRCFSQLFLPPRTGCLLFLWHLPMSSSKAAYWELFAALRILGKEPRQIFLSPVYYY